MRAVLVDLFVGVAGAAIFAVIEKLTLSLQGPTWRLATGGVFVLCFGVAALFQRKGGSSQPAQVAGTSVGSNNESGGSQTIETADVEVQKEGPTSIASANRSGKNQRIKVGKVTIK